MIAEEANQQHTENKNHRRKYAPCVDNKRAMGYRSGSAQAEKESAEADGRTEYIFGNHLLCRLRKINGFAQSKHNEKIQL